MWHFRTCLRIYWSGCNVSQMIAYLYIRDRDTFLYHKPYPPPPLYACHYIPFYLNPVHPTPSPTKRIICRGGIHAARAPRQYHQPNPCHPVEAGHARPAALSLHPFYLKVVGEGFIPPAHPTPASGKRLTCRGRRPRRPANAVSCRSAPTACGHRTTNPQHAPCPKIPLEICRKNQKQPLTIVIHIAIISKLSRGGHAAKSAS